VLWSGLLSKLHLVCCQHDEKIWEQIRNTVPCAILLIYKLGTMQLYKRLLTLNHSLNVAASYINRRWGK
jgi:hypothetical protein